METMDDDYDIYGDLDGFEVEAQKENKVIKGLKTEIEQLKAKIEEKEAEKQSITRENEILLENISSLLLTAKAELKRKDQLIADIRRQLDNTAFRRDRGNVRKHEQGTQTTLVRLLSQEVQTESVGTLTEPTRRTREETRQRTSTPNTATRKGVSSPKRGKSLERKKSAKPVSDLRVRVSDIRKERQKLIRERTPVGRLSEIRRNGIPRWDRTMERDRLRERERIRERERERERERRARHREAGRSPKGSPVRFSHPLRVTTRHQGGKDADSDPDVKLAETYIPMNRKELDQYVKEIARKENRSPDEMCCVDSARKKKKGTLDSAELWEVPTPIKKKEVPVAVVAKGDEDIIQSDEIGTTLSSPGNTTAEDVEKKMRLLHGESVTPESSHLPPDSLSRKQMFISQQPPKLVIPPVEPAIIEQVPDVPFEDDLRLNDSRELKIVESIEAVAELEELEDGEIASSDGEEVKKDKDHNRPSQTVSNDSGKKNNHKEAATSRHSKDDAVDKRHDSKTERKHSRRDRKADERSKKPDVDSKSKSRSRTDRFDTSTPLRPAVAHGRKSEDVRRETCTVVEKRRSSTRISDRRNEEHHGKVKKETLKELFGTDDENSLSELPTAGKRKPSVGHDETKDNKRQRVRSKERDSTNTGIAEVHCFRSPFEVCRKRTEIPPSIDSQGKLLVPTSIIPENTVAHHEKPPKTNVDTSQNDRLPITEKTSTSKDFRTQKGQSEEYSPQERLPVPPKNRTEEISVDVSQHEQSQPIADSSDSSEKDPTRSQQQDQSTTQEAAMAGSLHASHEASPAIGKRRQSVHRDRSKDNKKRRVRSKEEDTKDTTTEAVTARCEVAREQPSPVPMDVSKKEDSEKESRPLDKLVAPEEAPTEVPHQEEPPIVNACETEAVEEAVAEKSDEGIPEQALDGTSHLDQTSVEILQQEAPPDTTPGTDQRVSQEVVSVDLPQPNQTSSAASSEEVLEEMKQQDQPAQEVFVDTTSNASQPDEAPVEIAPLQDTVPEIQQEVSMEEINQPTAHNDSSELRNEDQPATEVSADPPPPTGNLLPMDASSAETPTKASQQQQLQNHHKSPEVVFFNKYGEYRVEDNNETEVTIYVTRTKKKKSKSNRSKLSSTVVG